MVRNDNNIKGLNIPSLDLPLKINLFADNTRIYLGAQDSLTYTQQAIKDWCDISGTKFNEGKTEIIPIGSEDHREQVLLTRKINQNDLFPIMEEIKIAQDSDAVRLLGGWIGNKIDDTTPWERILDQVHKNLEL